MNATHPCFACGIPCNSQPMAVGKEWYDAELSMDASRTANQRGGAAAGPAQALLQRIAQIPQVFYCSNPLVNSAHPDLPLVRRFRELGGEVGAHFGYAYPVSEDGHMMRYLRYMQDECKRIRKGGNPT